MNGKATKIGAIISGMYICVVAAAILWALINEGDASLGFLVPFFATMPLSWIFVTFFPLGYVGLGIAGITQGVILFFLVTKLSGFIIALTANKSQ